MRKREREGAQPSHPSIRPIEPNSGCESDGSARARSPRRRRTPHCDPACHSAALYSPHQQNKGAPHEIRHQRSQLWRVRRPAPRRRAGPRGRSQRLGWHVHLGSCDVDAPAELPGHRAVGDARRHGRRYRAHPHRRDGHAAAAPPPLAGRAPGHHARSPVGRAGRAGRGPRRRLVWRLQPLWRARRRPHAWRAAR